MVMEIYYDPVKELTFRFLDFGYFEKKDYNRLNKWSILGFDV